MSSIGSTSYFSSAVQRLQSRISGAGMSGLLNLTLGSCSNGLLASMQVGDLLLERMRGLQQKHNIIGDVRGQGLMLGVEMVKDQASKEPAAAETAQVSLLCCSYLQHTLHPPSESTCKA